jgi:hypothetical protein
MLKQNVKCDRKYPQCHNYQYNIGWDTCKKEAMNRQLGSKNKIKAR